VFIPLEAGLNASDFRLLEDFQVLKEVTAMNIENTVDASLIEKLQ